MRISDWSSDVCSSDLVEWRGPSPFIEIPADQSEDIKFAAKGLEYWGQVPVAVNVVGREFTTALFPKDGRYLLPLKLAVRTPLCLEIGQVVDVALDIRRP